MPIKRMQPVKSVVAEKPLRPATSVVTLTPEERMALVDKQIYEITGRIRKLKLLSILSLVAGVVLTAGFGALFWYQTGVIKFWELQLPLPLLGAAGFAYCAKLGNELRALAQERRSLAKEFPDSPYFHAPIEAP